MLPFTLLATNNVMATFLEAQTRLLREINRPSSEASVLLSVKDAINDAILQLQRGRTWTLAEAIANYAYPSGSATVTTTAAIGTVLRGLISVEQLSASTDVVGKPLKIMRYSQLQARRNQYMRRWPNGWEQEFWQTTLEEGYFNDKVLFITGTNVGLWPMPNSGTATQLRFCYYSWLAALSADADTNFFLTYAPDVVNAIALRKMCFVLKTTSNYLVNQAEFDQLIKNLEAWDDELRETSDTSIK